MTNRTKAIATAIVAGFFAVPANATDLLHPSPPILTDWSGPYIGLGIGYSSLTKEFEEYSKWSKGDRTTLNEGSFLATARIGYDWQVGNVVFGPFADVDWRNIDSAEIETDNFCYSGGARLGLLFSETLGYVNGGVTFCDVDIDLGGDKFGSDDAKPFAGGGLQSPIGNGFDAALEGRATWEDSRAPDGVHDGIADGSKVEELDLTAKFLIMRKF